MLSADVSHRYLITYTPVNQAADGTWRAIALMTSEPAYTVRARTGYFAPRPPPVRAAMEFTVTGAGHQFLDVTRDDITVFEDGVEQTVDSFQEAVSPVSIVLALDTSGSMRAAAAAVQDAARSFVGALRPEDRLATILFSDRPRFVHDLSLNRRFSLDAIDEYVARGGTALYDATYDALSRLEREAGRRAVVVLTDGRDENNPGTAPGSLRTFDEVLARVRETEAIVFTIGLGPQVDRDVLARLAAESGGDAYFPEDVSTLAADYARIIEHLRRRFVIGYTSTNSTRDGAWRRVEIVCRHPESTVRSQGGYRGPAK
jgi:Ca-activated chloride channel family protein